MVSYMRENPSKTLLAKGTQFLSAELIKVVICDN
jgi:hypothetical protein